MKTLFTALLFAVLTGAGSSASATVAPKLPDYSVLGPAAAKARVRIVPGTAAQGTLTVLSQGNKSLFFYVFDLEGKLVEQLLLKGKQKKTITGLAKGLYTYDVFEKNESIEHGKITIK
jgi:hypothetical protein